MQRVAQLVWPAVYGNELVKRTATFAEWQVGGAVLMTWPDAATTAQLQALKSAGTVPLLIGTDEEGGNVQRMARLGIIPAAATVASTMTPAAAEQMIAAHAAVVKAAGVDIVFAPVVDVSPRVGVGPIGNRAFSSDPKVVTEFAQAYVQGWESAGILPVLKHFPGHGSASGDTHKLNATTPALDVLRARDLLPYAALAGTGVGVMVGHLDVPRSHRRRRGTGLTVARRDHRSAARQLRIRRRAGVHRCARDEGDQPTSSGHPRRRSGPSPPAPTW